MLKVCGDPDKRRADGRFALRQPSEGSKATHYYGIIAIFILSAALGSITTEHFGNYAILFCVIPLCACLWILAQNRDTLR